MKKSLLMLCLLLAGFSFVFGQSGWVGLNSAKPQQPVVSILNSTDEGLTAEVRLPGVFAGEVTAGGSTYKRLSFGNNQSTKEVGMPELPMVSEIIGIPGNRMVKVEILEKTTTTLFTDVKAYPFQTPEKDIAGGKSSQFVIDQKFYSGEQPYPLNQVYMSKPEIWRDVRVSGLHIIPFSYNPATSSIEAVTYLKLRVTFYGEDVQNPLHRDKKVSPDFFRMYRQKILNFECLGLTEFLSSDTMTKYLVITNTGALSSIQPLVDWKNRQGFRVEVRAIGPGFSTPQNFKDYITQLYNTDDLEYILMVGDAYPNGGSAGGPNIVPMYYWAPSGEDPTYSDSWYSCMDGPDDHYADLAIGRFVYNNLSELELQIEKTLTHYFTPDTTTNWAEHSILVAHEENYPQKYTQCKEEVRTYAYPLQVPLFNKCYGGAGAGNQDIVDFINDTSCGIFNYRGHGSATELWEWGATGSFTATHVNQLTNTGRMFVFFDVCCDNMDIVAYNGECLCESFMKHPAACVAVNGAIIPSYTIPNHDYDKEMYKAVFEEGIYNVGYVTNFANITVLNVHGTLGRSNVRTYLWLGDASLEPWTLHPMEMAVSHDPQIYLGLSTYTVQVTGVNGPLGNARVCVSNASGSIYAVAFTDGTGIANVQFVSPIQDPGMAMVTVSAHNYLPYLGSVPVIPQSGPYVVKDNFVISDTSGNNNGLADYGETVSLSLGLKNVGISMASNVSATLVTTDPYVTVVDSTATYGDINPGSVLSVPGGFSFSLANNIPNNHWIPFVVKATDGTNLWSSNFSIQGHAPVLAYQSFTIADPLGNNNGKLDAGETATLTITVKNNGTAEAYNITGTLSTADTYITVNDTTKTYGNLAAGATGQQTYGITVDTLTPVGHPVLFGFDISANLGISGSGTFKTVVGQIPVLILNFDPNNNSAPSMQAALTALNVPFQVETAIPADLNMYSSVFTCLGIYSDNHQLSSAEGQELADYLNSGGRLYMEGGDTWYYDPTTPVHPLFNIDGVDDGSSNLGTISGQQGTFTEGMNFNYSGENNWIDEIDPIGNAFTIFRNNSPSYGTGVANDALTYKTIGCSHEFGGLDDASFPSTKTELMHQYLIFFGLMPEALSAQFTNSIPQCAGSPISFIDNSTGNPTIWYWSFPGGTPSSSTLQNPVVTYSAAGTYNITLIVGNGTTFDTLVATNFNVFELPVQASIPSGPAQACNNTVTTYTTTPLTGGLMAYNWVIDPASAGTLAPAANSVTVTWNNQYTGTASISVSGQNQCGIGPASPVLSVSLLAAPAVTLNTFANVCLNTPPFQLTGGSPAGGTYSGPGVSNNIFNPQQAGFGTKTIQYAYAAGNGCTGVATRSIFVDPCTGIGNVAGNNRIRVYPNPSHEYFIIETENITSTVKAEIFNSLGAKVAGEEFTPGSRKEIRKVNITTLSPGIYSICFKSEEGVYIEKLIIR